MLTVFCYTISIVVNNIPEILSSRKAINIALVLIIASLGVFSFGLGRLSATDNSKATILTCEKTLNTSESATLTSQGQLVASKNGTAYHYPWCSGAKRISEVNKIWFDTKEEAELAGYRPAANCKGL